MSAPEAKTPEAAAAEPILEVEGLRVNYRSVVAVNGIDLTVPRGAIVTVVGPNGAGKTSALRALGGQLKSRGSVRLGGQDISGWKPHKIAAAGLAQVPQGRRLFPDLTVRENLLLGGWGADGEQREAGVKRAEELFPRLAERTSQQVGSLSGGEQQMVAIGRALVRDPALIALDEPSLGLAPIVVSQVFDAIAQIRREGTSILLVEQNAAQAFAICDFVYVLSHGDVVHRTDSATALDEQDLVQAYLK
jgi:branched-chain amino acid transport system ATP-binding protein